MLQKFVFWTRFVSSFQSFCSLKQIFDLQQLSALKHRLGLSKLNVASWLSLTAANSHFDLKTNELIQKRIITLSCSYMFILSFLIFVFYACINFLFHFLQANTSVFYIHNIISFLLSTVSIKRPRQIYCNVKILCSFSGKLLFEPINLLC